MVDPPRATYRRDVHGSNGGPDTMSSTDQAGVSFDSDIKPLFRESDRDAMEFAFDLWSYDDVRTNAAAILDQLQQRSMPCDGAWSDEQVQLFQRWVEGGTAH
jgi:hypothetical protein